MLSKLFEKLTKLSMHSSKRIIKHEQTRKLYPFHKSFIGASHIKENKVCQDFAISFSESKYSVAIVCDGHGGDRYFRSHIGSKTAAEVFLKTIQEVFWNKGQMEKFETSSDKILQQLITNLIFQWREEVGKDFKSNPFTDSEKSHLSDKEKSTLEGDGWIKAYGTTMIAVVRTIGFWFGLHIGDGKCVTVSENDEYNEPIPWDDKCFLNSTTSLCDSDASMQFRYLFSKENLPVAIFVGTDGIDDSFSGTQGLNSFYEALLKTIKAKGIEGGLIDLEEYLPKLSEKGSGDDVSVAGIILM